MCWAAELNSRFMILSVELFFSRKNLRRRRCVRWQVGGWKRQRKKNIIRKLEPRLEMAWSCLKHIKIRFSCFSTALRVARCVWLKPLRRRKRKFQPFFLFVFLCLRFLFSISPPRAQHSEKRIKIFSLPSLFCCCCFYVSSSVVMERMFDCAERRQRNTLWYVYLIHMSMNMRTQKIVFVRLRIYIPAAAVKARHKHWIQPEHKSFWWLHACVNNCLVYSFFLVLFSFIIHRHHTSIPFYTIFQYSQYSFVHFSMAHLSSFPFLFFHHVILGYG